MRLLLDAHLPTALAVQLRQRGHDAAIVAEWQDGRWRTAPDQALLAAAHADRRLLVTFDAATIPPLLKLWAETSQHHAGVILVSSRSFAPNDIGGLLRAILRVTEQMGDLDWEDRVIFLVPA